MYIVASRPSDQEYLYVLGSPLEFYLLDIHFEVLHFFRFEIKPTDHFKFQSSKLFFHLID